MRIRRLAPWIVSSMLGPVCAIGLAQPATAEPVAAATRLAPVSFTGYIWSTNLSAAPLDHYYEFNTAAASVSTSHPATGQYTVTWTGSIGILSPPTIDLTTYDSAVSCDDPLLSSSAGQLEVGVDCFSSTGTPADAQFDLMVGRPGSMPKGLVAYGLVTHPTRLVFSYNSARKRNGVRRLGAGRYAVTLGGPRATGVSGTVKVSAASIGSSCQAAGWHGTRSGEVVDVDCFSARGSRHDEAFWIGYARHGNLTGIRGAATADAFANRPTAASYRPAVQDNNTVGAHVTVKRTRRGEYHVIFTRSGGPSIADGGDVQVTAVGTRDRHCYVIGWGTTANPDAEIGCTDSHGNAVDSPFTVQWINDAMPW